MFYDQDLRFNFCHLKLLEIGAIFFFFDFQRKNLSKVEKICRYLLDVR